ncbi:hypothetical protein GCM10010172_07010 [Paractinoplanes ferrugineus]|uniref:Uncharacterized protein n=1 Tax=Paractinoplanes ferrugineus TaxID=113564 RepID=A0A919J7H5_9ACTN|nr:hypothetical protein [Actinoplanes ferrugineus]GIE16271.1 hypothetical protein Afe05nite_81110 [Actinoplanes ferrugineus]
MTITDINPTYSTVEEVHAALTATQSAMVERAGDDGDLPVYLKAVNPWRPWLFRVGGGSLGVALAAITSIVIDQDVFYPATFTTLGAAFVYAWVLGGYEHTELHPTRFEKAA